MTFYLSVKLFILGPQCHLIKFNHIPMALPFIISLQL
uniref:Uncharacterized protein n=1 Tax=Arundo donax TaxID=35708 RepID=A0A0A9A1X1_ARUDO